MAVDIAYAKRGDLSLAYTTLGDGPVDVIVGAGLVSHLDLLWGDPSATAWLQRLVEGRRLLLFDKPGTGLSDPVVGVPTLEQRADDYLAVLDAAGSERAVVIGISEAGPAAGLLAATHPERVSALVLVSTYAKTVAADDFLPHLEGLFEGELWPPLWRAAERWGDGEFIRWLSPKVRHTPVYSRLAPSIERSCASPAMVRAIVHSMRAYDARDALPLISAPTLVVGRTAEIIPVEVMQDLANRVPGARLQLLPGEEHITWFDGDDIADAIIRFLDAPGSTARRPGRSLATLVYTDIVGSTAAAVEVGDHRWRALVARHDEITEEAAAKHGGRVVKTLGDGALMTFDRPSQAVRCAVAIRDGAAELGVTIRAAVHSGECEIVGEDISGIAAHIGSRLLSHAGDGEVVVSGTVRDLTLGAGLDLVERGTVELRDVPGSWEVLAVRALHQTELRPASRAAAPARQTSSAEATMTRADRSIVSLSRSAPGLTRALLTIAGKVRRSG